MSADGEQARFWTLASGVVQSLCYASTWLIACVFIRYYMRVDGVYHVTFDPPQQHRAPAAAAEAEAEQLPPPPPEMDMCYLVRVRGMYFLAGPRDKDNAKYRLVGVIEHCQRTIIGGHFVAYVRESRIVSEQETSSSSSSWFRANDNSIREVSLDEVLKCEAFLLFYEKAAKTIVFHNADLKEELDENSRGCVYHGYVQQG